MADDRRLLEAAARAAGLTARWDEECGELCIPLDRLSQFRRRGDWRVWNPLQHDEDALRLAVELRIDVIHLPPCGVGAAHNVGNKGIQPRDLYTSDNDHEGDHYAATRRAIVRAAASIGDRS